MANNTVVLKPCDKNNKYQIFKIDDESVKSVSRNMCLKTVSSLYMLENCNNTNILTRFFVSKV
jgi:hypothetical protein